MPAIDCKVNIHENEIKMANNLIDSLTETFDPEKYHNQYRQALTDLIESKITGEEFEFVPRPETGKVVDLMEALKASIQLAKDEKERSKEKGKGKRKAATKKKAAETLTS